MMLFQISYTTEAGVQTEQVDADDLLAAFDVATQRGEFPAACVVEEAPAAETLLDSAVTKLMKLGLTADEARAIAGVV